MTRGTLARLVQDHGCTMTIKQRKRGQPIVYLRDQGALIYLGTVPSLERLSEEALAAKIRERIIRMEQ